MRRKDALRPGTERILDREILVYVYERGDEDFGEVLKHAHHRAVVSSDGRTVGAVLAFPARALPPPVLHVPTGAGKDLPPIEVSDVGETSPFETLVPLSLMRNMRPVVVKTMGGVVKIVGSRIERQSR
jgi:hypothetical protein